MDKKKLLYIGIGSVLLIGLVWGGLKIFTKSKDNNDGNNNDDNNDINNNEKYDPANDLKTLEGYILGYNIITYEKSVQNLFNSLDDEQLKVLANSWEEKHNEKLWTSLDNEFDGCGTFGLSNCYEAPMRRLKSLGL